MRSDVVDDERHRRPDAAPFTSMSPLFQPQRMATIRSPHHVNEMLWQAMPPHERNRLGEGIVRARKFEPVDRRGYQADPGDFGLSVALAQAGGTRISASAMRRGMVMTVMESMNANYTFGVRLRGSVSISGAGFSQDGTWGPGTGVLYREERGTRVATSNEHAGIAFELPYARIAAILEGQIERPVGSDFRFNPGLALQSEPGASVARVVAFIEQELSTDASLLASGRAGPAMEDMLISALLLAQPHSYSGLLEREAGAAAPYNVTRAIAFMRAHADESINLERLAAVAGCSVRSLQAAFRRWRGDTPMAELRRIRLELAHQELRAAYVKPTVAEVATKYGFSNLGRFSGQYRAAFGQSPSQTRRRQR